MSTSLFDDDELYDDVPAPMLSDEPAGHDDEPQDAGDADLLAPPSFGGPEDAEAFTDEGDGGISDPDKIVRLWFDDGQLSKVRLSPVWFRRITGSDTLENHFRQALLVANVRVAKVPEGEPEPDDEYPDVDFSGLPDFDDRSFAAYMALVEEFNAQWDEAIAAADGAAAPEVTPTVGRVKGVTVTLDRAGRASEVAFDEKWLDDAQVGQICNAVVAAAQDAYSRYSPPERDETLDRFADEHKLLMAGFRKLVTPKEMR